MKKRAIVASLVVVALVVIAVAASVTWREEYRKDARAAVQLDMLASNLRDYATRHGGLPSGEKALDSLVADGQFQADALIDPWGRHVEYRCMDVACKSAEIKSLGDPSAAPPSPIIRNVKQQ